LASRMQTLMPPCMRAAVMLFPLSLVAWSMRPIVPAPIALAFLIVTALRKRPCQQHRSLYPTFHQAGNHGAEAVFGVPQAYPQSLTL
jgi:hypothetical protein